MLLLVARTAKGKGDFDVLSPFVSLMLSEVAFVARNFVRSGNKQITMTEINFNILETEKDSA